MRWPRRQHPPPAPQDLDHGERVIAAAPLDDGGTITVTTHRLVVDGPESVRCPWHLIDSGGYRPDRDELWASFVDERPRQTWRISAPAQVPDAFRERVQASVVLVERVDIDRATSARVVLRKDLSDGALSVQVLYKDGADPDHPELRAGVADSVTRLAEHVGREL